MPFQNWFSAFVNRIELVNKFQNKSNVNVVAVSYINGGLMNIFFFFFRFVVVSLI